MVRIEIALAINVERRILRNGPIPEKSSALLNFNPQEIPKAN